MACQKKLTFSQLVSGDAPLMDAAYVPSVNKIFGTSGPYVIQFNADTGQREAFARLYAPMYGTNRICYHSGTDKIFAAGHNELNNHFFGLTHPGRDVYQIDPVSLLVTGLNVGDWLPFWDMAQSDQFGPAAIMAYGDYLYFQDEQRNLGFYWGRVKASDFTAHDVGTSFADPVMHSEQIAVDGTYVYLIDPRDWMIHRDLLSGTADTFCSVNPLAPVGIVYCTTNSKIYCVCGNSTLIRIDDFATSAHTELDLTSVIDPVTLLPVSPAPDPVRIKCLSDGLLYMPCMGAEGVILWDTSTETGEWLGGCSNPVDVVETPTKVWAVQNSFNGLHLLT